MGTFHDSTEASRIKRIRQTTKQKFRTEDTPQPSDMHHLAVSRLMDELLLVKAEELQHHPGAERENVEKTGDVAVFKEAERLLQKHGASIFATALALLGRAVVAHWSKWLHLFSGLRS